MSQALAYLLKQIHVRAGSGFMLYHLWGSLDDSVLDRERSNRAPTATSYTKLNSRKLLIKLFDTDEQDAQAVADWACAIVANCDAHAPTVRGETPNALGIIVDRVFSSTFDQAFYDNDTPFSAKEVAYRLRDSSRLSLLWEMPFKRNFSACLKSTFPEATDNAIELFWDEYDQLLLVPFLPTSERIDSAPLEEQKRELKRILELHVALLLVAALLGPGVYFKNVGLVPPASNITLPYGFKPPRVISASSARLQPVIMLGNGPAEYYTDENSDVVSLNASDGTIVFGRDPVAGNGGRSVKIKSALQNVSRQHAQLSYDIDSGWLLRDIGTEQEGSSWGTLVLYASGGSAHLFDEETLLHHGDIICFAPELHERLGSPVITPPTGVEDLCFRFEVTAPPKRR